MRIVFAGSPEIAVPTVTMLLLSQGPSLSLAAVITNDDSRRGRSSLLESTDVGKKVEAWNAEHPRNPVPLIKTDSIGREVREQIGALKPDLLVSFACSRIFGPRFLSLFPLGGINIHPSLLPRYRGASPIQTAILKGDSVTGITIQKLAVELDSGDILVQEKVDLTGRETTESLSALMAEKGALLLRGLIREAIAQGALPPGRPQGTTGISHCLRISKDEGRIDWKADVLEIDARIRAYIPWPLCYTYSDDKELYLLEASPYSGGFVPPANPVPGQVLGIDKDAGILIQTGSGILALEKLQYKTKKALGWKDFLNGARNFIGSRLGEGREKG